MSIKSGRYFFHWEEKIVKYCKICTNLIHKSKRKYTIFFTTLDKVTKM